MTDIGMRDFELAALKEGHLVCMGFCEGYIFARVKYREPFNYLFKRIKTVDGTPSGNPVPMGADEFITYQQLRDNLNRIIFGTNTSSGDSQQKDELVQMFIGLSPATTKLWIRDPITVARWGLDLIPAAPDNATQRDNAFINGFDSPLYNPSIRSERFQAYFMNWDVAFQNDSPVPNVCNARFVGYRHRIEILNPAKPADRGIITNILSARIPARLVTMGGIRNPVSDLGSGGCWNGVKPIPLTTDEIAKLQGGA